MKTLKNITTALVLSSIALTASAAYEDGFYIGGAVGGNYANVEQETKHNDGTTTNKFNDKDSALGGQFSIFTGYLMNLEDFIIAPELFAQYDTNKTAVKNKNTTLVHDINHKVESPFNFGALVKIGVPVQEDLMVYGLAGVKFAYTKIKIDDKSDPAERISTSDKKFVPLFVYGVGIEKELCSTHRIGLQATHTFGSKTFTTKGGNPVQTYSSKVKTSEFGLELRYSIPL